MSNHLSVCLSICLSVSVCLHYRSYSFVFSLPLFLHTFSSFSLSWCVSSFVMRVIFYLYPTYLNTSMIVPFPRWTQAFLLTAINWWIFVSIEFTIKVSGTQSLSVASPLRIIVLLRPNPKRGSRQNCPMYKSTENS